MANHPIQLLLVVIDLAGGTGTFCRALAGGLRRFYADEFDLTLLLLRARGVKPGDEQLFSRIHVIKTEVHTDWRRLFETPVHAWRLRRALKSIDSDLVLTVSTYANLLVPLVSPGRRVIQSVHTNTTEQLKGSRFAGLIGRLMRWRYPKRAIVVPTRGVAEDLQRNYGVAGAKVIPHGVDAEAIRAMAAEEVADVAPGRPYIVACGRLTAQKDYPTLLEAYAMARRRGVEEDLVIIGDGEEKERLERMAQRLSVGGAVHFLGHRDNVFPYMQRARFFVLSSIWEGFGLVLLEAMSLGLPVVATDCPSGPAEILDNGRYGLLSPVRDSAALSEAMVSLGASQELRESLSRQSRLRAQELSIERMAREYRELFISELTRWHDPIIG